MSSLQPRQLVEKTVEALFKKDQSALSDLADPQAAQAMQRAIAPIQSAMPDMRATTSGIIAEGNHVVVSWQADGSFNNALFGIQPNHRKIQLAGALDLQVSGSRVTSLKRSFVDSESLLKIASD